MNVPKHKSYANLSFEDRSALKDVKSNLNLTIREADKGCSLLIDWQRNIEEGFRQLNNASAYLKTHATTIDEPTSSFLSGSISG